MIMYGKKHIDQLLDALENVTSSLECWMEIQDPEDARKYDEDAVKNARKLLGKWKTYR